MAGRLAGKVAFVTGAARGQGRSHCVRMAEEGASIIATDICAPIDTVEAYPLASPEDLEQTAAEVERLGQRVLTRSVDVRDLEAMQSVVRDGVAELGPIDVVVANAAIAVWSAAWDVTAAQWRDVIDVNLTGVWNTARSAIPSMIEAGSGGSIIFTGSAAAAKGFANVGPYVAAKHGVIGLMRNLAVELGPHRIRVNTINPTNVDTPLIQHPTMWNLFVPDVDDPSQDQIATAMAGMNTIPVPWIDPVDVSNAVVFLASDESRYVTGAAFPVDAGATAK